jgi:hypothetical protein
MSVLLAGGLPEAEFQCETEAGEGVINGVKKALRHKKSLNLLD